MKKLIIILCLIFISACNMKVSNQNKNNKENAAAPNIMVDNRFYHTTGELYDGRPLFKANKEDYEQQFEVDGTITSSVKRYKLPNKNNESNFGTGYKYHIESAEIILVYIDDLWIRFEYADSNDSDIKQ